MKLSHHHYPPVGFISDSSDDFNSESSMPISLLRLIINGHYHTSKLVANPYHSMTPFKNQYLAKDRYPELGPRSGLNNLDYNYMIVPCNL